MFDVNLLYRVGERYNLQTTLNVTESRVNLSNIADEMFAMYSDQFQELGAHPQDIVVYRVPVDYELRALPTNTLKQRVIDLLESQRADVLDIGFQKLSKIFDGETLDDEQVHLIFQCTKEPKKILKPEAKGGLLSMSKELDIATSKAEGSSSPSTMARNVSNFIWAQRTRPIYNGRLGRIGPSVTLFHSAFANFVADMKRVDDAEYLDDLSHGDGDDEVDNGTITAALARVIAAVSDIHESENDLFEAIRGDLSTLFGAPVINTPLSELGCTYVTPNAAPTTAALQSVVEGKLGMYGGDAGVQASAIWRDEVFGDAYKPYRMVSACPSFLVSLQGQYLGIQGSVLMPRPVTEHLTDLIYIGLGPRCETRALRLPSILRIYRRANRALRDYYLRLVPDANSPYIGWVPQPTFPQDVSAEHRAVVDHLEYLSLLEYEDREADDFRRALYLGLLSGKKVVVKFCERYCPDAHRLLADHDRKFAPTLHLCTRLVGGLYMVVMDYIEGSVVSKAFRKGAKVRLPSPLHDQVKTALDVLHKNRYVYGDLRGPNILKTADNRAMLIDFDWAGKEGEARYSALMNPDIEWAKGASPSGLILKQHDWDMLALMYPDRVEEGLGRVEDKKRKREDDEVGLGSLEDMEVTRDE
ncbi:hypothetical protein FA95DRAFT_1676989 [Auriscalpium vulgare]|uniref:Uncharacterized protein n=1 Tax=Auriscalpium vulgare TaxID=40419 RepID=A0ACB8S0W2_9AGAM|nr:hypothetical protein FA95DRAFT_1676989 [Auriscalpium vulgare]